jgi:hypothetical protein
MTTAAYANLPEAIRIIVRLMPDCETLAPVMTYKWITGSARLLEPAPEDEGYDKLPRQLRPDGCQVRPRMEGDKPAREERIRTSK